MTILFVNNHISDLTDVKQICDENNLKFGGTLLSKETPMLNGYSYAISPIEFGYAHTLALLSDFDDVVFLTNHDNYAVKLMQLEFETIYRAKKIVNEYI